MSKPPTGVLVRWVFAALFCAAGVVLLSRVNVVGLGWDTLDKTLVGLGALFVALLFIGPEVVSWVVTPVYYFVDQLLIPSESEPPPANFKLARYYAGQLRHEEACEEYAKIIRFHPEESAAYLEGIQEAFLAGNRDLAKKFYAKGRRIMRAPGERKLLRGVYAAQHEIGDEAGETPGDGGDAETEAILE